MVTFKDLLIALKSLLKRAPAVNPERFNDPLALKTEWTPLQRGGTNFRTHRLIQMTPLRWEFRPTFAARAFGGVFLGFGLLAVGFALAVLYKTNQPGVLALVPFGVVFGVAGFFVLKAVTKPIVFDRQLGLYWKGKVDPMAALQQTLSETTPGAPSSARLMEIGALQLISENCSGKSSYHSFELNLVLKDGRRLNVVDHGSLASLHQDAAELARFLSIPLWDAC